MRVGAKPSESWPTCTPSTATSATGHRPTRWPSWVRWRRWPADQVSARQARLRRPARSGYTTPVETRTAPLIGGRYRIDGLLGEGGMARVFDAFDERLERPAAVKILRAETRALPGMRRAVPAGGADRRTAHPSPHRRRAGLRRRSRVVLSRDGAPARDHAARRDRRPWAVVDPARPARDGRDARRSGGRPRSRGAAPRHQAQQHPAAAGRAHEDHRFRHRQELRHPDGPDSAGRRHDDDGSRPGHTRATSLPSGGRAIRPPCSPTCTRSVPSWSRR